jgi:hypothetical protein
MGVDDQKFYQAELKRLVRQEHTKDFVSWLPNAREVVAAHYSELDLPTRAKIEVSVASALSTQRSNEQLYILLNELLLKVSEKGTT